MNKVVEYKSIANLIKAELGQSSKALALLEQELFPSLHSQKEEKVPQTTPSEILREYINISREIQATLFDMISRNVLAIEKVSDHILCRRAYHERNSRKSAPHTIAAPKATNNAAEDLLAKFATLTAGMSIAEAEEYMKKLRGD